MSTFFFQVSKRDQFGLRYLLGTHVSRYQSYHVSHNVGSLFIDKLFRWRCDNIEYAKCLLALAATTFAQQTKFIDLIYKLLKPAISCVYKSQYLRQTFLFTKCTTKQYHVCCVWSPIPAVGCSVGCSVGWIDGMSVGTRSCEYWNTSPKPRCFIIRDNFVLN